MTTKPDARRPRRTSTRIPGCGRELAIGKRWHVLALLAAAAAVGESQGSLGLVWRMACTPAFAAGPAKVMRGGILVESDGWYSLSTEPPCPGASLRVDGESVEPDRLRPLLAGVHAFEITVTDPATCPLPVQVRMKSGNGPQVTDALAPLLVSPGVAALPQARAPQVLPYPGYAEPRPLPGVPDAVVDFGVDAGGVVHALTEEGGRYRVRRFAADGQELGAWEPAVPPGRTVRISAAAPDGSWLIGFDRTAIVYDSRGQLRGTWSDPNLTPWGIAFLPDGRILACVPSRAAIAIVRPDGRVETEWNTFAGGPGKFHEPLALAQNAAGDLLVIQGDGLALLFHTPPDRFEPTFVRSFRVAFVDPSTHARGTTFAGEDRIVLSDPVRGATLVYNRDGRRMLATDPARDLSAANIGPVLRFRAAGDLLYALGAGRKIWVLSPLPGTAGSESSSGVRRASIAARST